MYRRRERKPRVPTRRLQGRKRRVTRRRRDRTLRDILLRQSRIRRGMIRRRLGSRRVPIRRRPSPSLNRTSRLLSKAKAAASRTIANKRKEPPRKGGSFYRGSTPDQFPRNTLRSIAFGSPMTTNRRFFMYLLATALICSPVTPRIPSRNLSEFRHPPPISS